MRQPILLDGRNVYDPDTMAERGFIYRGVGRGVPRPEHSPVGEGFVSHEELEQTEAEAAS